MGNIEIRGRNFVIEPCSKFKGCHIWKVKTLNKKFSMKFIKPETNFKLTRSKISLNFKKLRMKNQILKTGCFYFSHCFFIILIILIINVFPFYCRTHHTRRSLARIRLRKKGFKDQETIVSYSVKFYYTQVIFFSIFNLSLII